MTVLDAAPVQLPRSLAKRVLAALRATLTPAGHLAQRVTHEHLGYCSWRSESDRCVDMRALIADVEHALEDVDPSLRSRGAAVDIPATEWQP